MTPNQSWRSNLLRTVYLHGPQPVELRFFQNRMSDTDSKKWLENNGLEHYLEHRDISVYNKTGTVYWAIPRTITFIWIAALEPVEVYDQPQLRPT